MQPGVRWCVRQHRQIHKADAIASECEHFSHATILTSWQSQGTLSVGIRHQHLQLYDSVFAPCTSTLCWYSCGQHLVHYTHMDSVMHSDV